MLLPDIDYVEIPVDWWNAEADKSLLIGVFKHGVYPAVWWVLLCEPASTSGTGGETSCQCEGQSRGCAPQPHRARTAVPRCQQHFWVGNRHPTVPRVAMPDLVVDWFARSSVQLLSEGEEKGTDLFLVLSWSPHAVSRRPKAVCPSCALRGGCAAAGWDGKADLSLCLLPRGCRSH